MCGYPHPEIMLRETGLTARQLEETLTFLRLFPRGDKRMDLRFSLLATLISYVNGGNEIKVDFDAPTYKLAISKEAAAKELMNKIEFAMRIAKWPET